MIEKCAYVIHVCVRSDSFVACLVDLFIRNALFSYSAYDKGKKQMINVMFLCFR